MSKQKKAIMASKEEDKFTETLEALNDKNIYYKIAMVKREIGKLTKKSDNPFYKSKYLELSDLLEAVEPLLDKWGLVLLQPILDGKVCSTIIDVETADTVGSEVELPNITDPQKLGGAITYYRRYTLQSLLALQAVDDDGNEASKTVKKQGKPKLSNERFKASLKAIKEGDYDADSLKSNFSLTPEQLKQL